MGSSGGTGCYWARLNDLNGGISSIGANDNVDGLAIVDVLPEEFAFTSARCGTWTRVG